MELQALVPSVNAIVPSAQSAGIVQEIEDDTIEMEPSVEMVEDDALALANEDDILRDIDDQIHQIANHFWQQTERLTVHQVLLQGQQNYQSQAQEAALRAVHAEAQSSVNQLAEHHRMTMGQIEIALSQCRDTMEQNLLQAVLQQGKLTEEVQADLSAKIQEVLTAAQKEISAARQQIAHNADETARVEQRLRSALAGVQSEVAQQIESTAKRVGEQLESHKREVAPTQNDQDSERLSGRVRFYISKTVSTMENSVETRLRNALQQATRDQAKEIHDAETRLELKLRKLLQDQHRAIDEGMSAQQASIDAVCDRVTRVDERYHELDERVKKMEAIAVGNHHGSFNQVDLEDEVAKAIKTAIVSALRGGRVKRMQRKSAHPRTSTIEKVINAAQKCVQQRSEAAARYVDMRRVANPRDESLSIYE